jgi:hypothetical protein
VLSYPVAVVVVDEVMGLPVVGKVLLCSLHHLLLLLRLLLHEVASGLETHIINGVTTYINI